MTRSTIIVLLVTLQAACGEVPRFFTKHDFKPIDFAEAVNHFVNLRQGAAVKELLQLASEGDVYHYNRQEGFFYDVRVGLICRVLFEGRDGRALRPPQFGVLEDLPPPDLMATNWPQFPLTKSGSTYFVLSEGYISVSGDGREEAKTYIEYCCQNGIFREQPVVVPARQKVLEDLAALKTSAAWKSIKWTYNYNGRACVLDEGFVWKFIESQANRAR